MSSALRVFASLTVVLFISGLEEQAIAAGNGVASEADAASDAALQAPSAHLSVIPQPADIEFRAGIFAIRTGTRLSFPHDPRAARVARYFAQLMQDTRGIKLEMSAGTAAAHGIVLKLEARQPSAAASNLGPAAGDSSAADGDTGDEPHVSSSGARGANPEGYAIDVSADHIVLSASDPRGLLYAAVTLWQLGTSHEASTNEGIVTIPAVKIVDSPRFAWRGLLLDSARHYQSPEFILRLIDWMALHKLNVLHWHLTDDQAWRLEIKKYPRLTSVGAWRLPAGGAAAADIDPATGRPRLYGGFYSQETVRRIVARASERNITVVPEIDMPGHATAAIVAYPRLASIVPAPAAVTSNWGVYSNLYNVDEDTFQFLENVLAEVVQLFPSQYIHVGGDEAVKDQWQASPRVKARMRELGVPNEAALQSYFIARMGRFLTAHHRRLIGWDEILEGGIAPDATITSWRGIAGAVAAAAAGHDSVLSPAPTLYLDHQQSVDDTQPGNAAPITLEDVYRFDPMPPALRPDQRHHILGVQANIWTEHIRTEERVEYMAFPRAAAVAEVGWSAPGSLDWSGFLARLPDQMNRYRMLGIQAFGEQPAPGAALEQPPSRRSSHQLRSCTREILLSLEDDAPSSGDRATFLVDIMNPCWIYPAVDLSRVSGIAAAVGQLPFEFQLGADVHVPRIEQARTASGELEVRLDGCEGQIIASVSLQPALRNDAVTELPTAKLAHHDGMHDLCLKFAQRSPDPMWVIDWVQLLE